MIGNDGLCSSWHPYGLTQVNNNPVFLPFTVDTGGSQYDAVVGTTCPPPAPPAKGGKGGGGGGAGGGGGDKGGKGGDQGGKGGNGKGGKGGGNKGG
ncbi:MAG: hypothetical protein ACYDH5_18425 [Acidimicrobiales bacterium]